MLGATTYTLTRPGAGAYSQTTGLWVPAASSTIEVYASIQPMSEQQLQRAPEGVRASKGVTIYAQLSPAIRTADVLQVADLITYQGVVYEVRLVDPYNPLSPLPHIKALAYASETGEALP
jgi:hypothetical protein